MGQLIQLLDRSPLIKNEEWTEFVSLARDIQESEELLEGMRRLYLAMKANILRQLAEGAKIENSGQIARAQKAKTGN